MAMTIGTTTLRTRQHRLAIGAALAAAVLLGGCSTSPSTPQATGTTTGSATPSQAQPTTQAEQSAVITIKDFTYQLPPSVSPGATVTVRNEDAANHTVTSKPKGAFDVLVKGRDSVTFTAPTEPGSYPITCSFHGSMSATLVVK